MANFFHLGIYKCLVDGGFIFSSLGVVFIHFNGLCRVRFGKFLLIKLWEFFLDEVCSLDLDTTLGN